VEPAPAVDETFARGAELDRLDLADEDGVVSGLVL
jgi:hypothetical protein